MTTIEELAQQHQEPHIVINGYTLAKGEAMTVRVALESFAMDMEVDGLGDDEHGKRMSEAYLKNIHSIRKYIFEI
jgi:hypothetical protein